MLFEQDEPAVMDSQTLSKSWVFPYLLAPDQGGISDTEYEQDNRWKAVQAEELGLKSNQKEVQVVKTFCIPLTRKYWYKGIASVLWARNSANKTVLDFCGKDAAGRYQLLHTNTQLNQHLLVFSHHWRAIVAIMGRTIDCASAATACMMDIHFPLVKTVAYTPPTNIIGCFDNFIKTYPYVADMWKRLNTPDTIRFIWVDNKPDWMKDKTATKADNSNSSASTPPQTEQPMSDFDRSLMIAKQKDGDEALWKANFVDRITDVYWFKTANQIRDFLHYRLFVFDKMQEMVRMEQTDPSRLEAFQEKKQSFNNDTEAHHNDARFKDTIENAELKSALDRYSKTKVADDAHVGTLEFIVFGRFNADNEFKPPFPQSNSNPKDSPRVGRFVNFILKMSKTTCRVFLHEHIPPLWYNNIFDNLHCSFMIAEQVSVGIAQDSRWAQLVADPYGKNYMNNMKQGDVSLRMKNMNTPAGVEFDELSKAIQESLTVEEKYIKKLQEDAVRIATASVVSSLTVDNKSTSSVEASKQHPAHRSGVRSNSKYKNKKKTAAQPTTASYAEQALKLMEAKPVPPPEQPENKQVVTSTSVEQPPNNTTSQQSRKSKKHKRKTATKDDTPAIAPAPAPIAKVSESVKNAMLEDIGQEQDKQTQEIIDQVLCGANKPVENKQPDPILPLQPPLSPAELELMQQHMQAVNQLGAAMTSLSTPLSSSSKQTVHTINSSVSSLSAAQKNTVFQDSQSIPMTTHEMERQITRTKQAELAFQLHMTETETRLNFLQSKISNDKASKKEKRRQKKDKSKPKSDVSTNVDDTDDLAEIVEALVTEKETLLQMLEKCGGVTTLSPENAQMWSDLQREFSKLPLDDKSTLPEEGKTK